MKGLHLVAMSVCVATATGLSAQAESQLDVKVMTFNIRCGTANDGDNSWANRHEQAAKAIRSYGAAVVGVQEAYRFQLDDLRKALPEYEEIGQGRDGGTKGEYSAILYRKDQLEVDESGTFWLSETPDVVSRSWNSACVRICTWAHLRDRASGVAFYVFNTHFDHRSTEAQAGGARVIAKAIAARKHPDPFQLMGDFNIGEDDPTLRYLRGEDGSPVKLRDSFRMIHPDADQVRTYHGFKGGTTGTKIDYIMVPEGVEALAADIVEEKVDGRYPSDHYPVTATLRFLSR
jgi:endonuclease/exonuclease/phosphatase family metal-dependent hydrolase